MTLSIHQIDQRTAPESALRDLHEVYLAVDRSFLPDDPPEPWEQRLADFCNYSSVRYSPKWLAYVDGELAGGAGLWMKTDQNLANCHGMAMVFPTFRGNGFGRQLTRAIVAEAGRKERMRISFDLPADSPFESLAEASGLKLVMRAKRSRLLISDIDVDLMGQWVARASERAGDYELLELTTPLPQEHVEEFVELMHVMNSAPFEDYEMEDEKFTVKNWREREALISARGESLILQIARHRPSGKLAGYTAINNQSLYPQQAWQWDTGVDPEHRNKGLGRWLKAANALRMLEEFPLVDRVDTYNAGSNEPMLNINVEMGFKPILVEHVYQGPVESVARWAADR